jgi:hypothetical protein
MTCVRLPADADGHPEEWRVAFQGSPVAITDAVALGRDKVTVTIAQQPKPVRARVWFGSRYRCGFDADAPAAAASTPLPARETERRPRRCEAS